MKQVLKLLRSTAIGAVFVFSMPAWAGQKTWIDSGNSAKIIDWYGWFGKVCVAAVDATSGLPVKVHLRREADGAGKDLDAMTDRRWLDTKGFRYEVWVQNIYNGAPIYAFDCGGDHKEHQGTPIIELPMPGGFKSSRIAQ